MSEYKQKSIVENDLVLVHIEDRPTFFARIENIAADAKRGWWRVKLLILQVPLIVTTWILDNEQIHGADFTMGGTHMRLEKVVAPQEPLKPKQPDENESEEQVKQNQRASIISMDSTDKK